MNPYRIVTRRLDFFQRLIHATYLQLFSLWLSINAVFAFIYLALARSVPAHAPTIPTGLAFWGQAFDSLYFSVITATTIGYGDIVPLGFSKFLAMTQSTLALLVFTVLVGKLVSQRQDTTLHEVHRMTFEGVFYHIRHVLFIVRKDFDDIIQKIRAHKKLDDQDWDNLATAYLQAHSLIEEIPDLYNGHGYDLHNVDLNHEKLLFEALHRTLTRVHSLISALDEARINWQASEASFREYRRLLGIVDGIMPLWNERSPFHDEQEFEDIRQLSMQLHEQLKEKTAAARHP